MLTKNRVFIIFIILISLIPLFDLFRTGLPITHDGQDHVARIANFYQNLKEGNFIPRWAGWLNWGYGHPILMFLYPLPSYAASFFHFFGFSFVDSVKLVFGLAYIASGLVMYLWIREFLNEKAAFASSVLYTFAPYRFIDLYVRGAIGEHVAFVFLPLILYFLLKISKKYSYWYFIGGSFSFAFLILSHNAITLMFLPLIFLYVLYLVFQSNKRLLLICQYISILAIGFGLAAFFLIPAFFEGKYTLRDIVIKGGYALSFVQFKDFLYGVWNYGGTGQFSVQVGLIHWLIVVANLPLTIILYKRKNLFWIIPFCLLIIFLATLFIMSSYSLFIWQKLTILQKFQFPWRFLSVTTFIASALGAIFIYTIPKKIQLFLSIILVSLVLFLNKDYWKAKDYLEKPESFYNNIYNGTTDTGESAPIWSVRFMEKRPSNEIEVIEGEAKIKKVKRTFTEHIYEISNLKNARVRENTLYFPGWNVFVDNEPIPVEFQDQRHRGLITFNVNPGKHIIKVQFQETKLRFFANSLTFLSLIFLIFWGIIRKTRLWQRFQ